MGNQTMTKHFDPTNKKKRMVMTPDGEGLLIAVCEDFNDKTIEYQVQLSATPVKCPLYKAEDLKEIEK